jgi:hypothetical protein
VAQALPECGITRFQERDIDLLLAEELRVNADFGRFVMQPFGLDQSLRFPARATTVSAVEDGTEIDVRALFAHPSGGDHALMIETKIDAAEMPDQLQRYARRGANDIALGRVAGASVLAVTPRHYRFSRLPEGARQCAFEDIAQWFRTRGDPRSDYRASVLEQALPATSARLRDARTARRDPAIRAWWDAVHQAVDAAWPGYFHHRTRYPQSVYFAPATAGQAAYLRVDFKGHKGEVDLAFKGVEPARLVTALDGLPRAPGRLVANGRSSALRIDGLAPFVISDGLAVIAPRVLPAYAAARQLLEFWRLHRTRFDSAVLAEPPP